MSGYDAELFPRHAQHDILCYAPPPSLPHDVAAAAAPDTNYARHYMLRATDIIFPSFIYHCPSRLSPVITLIAIYYHFFEGMPWHICSFIFFFTYRTLPHFQYTLAALLAESFRHYSIRFIPFLHAHTHLPFSEL